MAANDKQSPKSYQGVMISSTFDDLKEHRDFLNEALQKNDLFPLDMKTRIAEPGDDIIAHSLKMVQEGAGYIGIISSKYGGVETCSKRNPNGYSTSRLEFEEALRLKRPTLIFLMSKKYLVPQDSVEVEADKIKKLEEYRNRAKEGRIYFEFESMERFKSEVGDYVVKLKAYLDAHRADEDEPKTVIVTDSEVRTAIPQAPAFYAEPNYIGSHEFVGRRAELDKLNDWASEADTHPVLLFEAIGGNGKSMLTWEWVNSHVLGARDNWAGRFWYSFYERGAVMADFCQHALAYITGQPFEVFLKKKTPELTQLLLQQLQNKPWLLVLDGLERILVAYHRIDAAQLKEEDVDTAKDQMADRDPCAAIRPDDDDLLRALTGAGKSKILITSRLIPRILLNAASQPIPGVVRERLPGLRPPDAEVLLRNCGVTGDSKAMQDYLKTNCDCHPLVTGILAGLINDYLPSRGNFDTWVKSPDGGGKLNLAELNLVQKRNHILMSAIDALDDKSRQLLATLSMITESVDYKILAAINPYINHPEEVKQPSKPEEHRRWERINVQEREEIKEQYQVDLGKYELYLRQLKEYHESDECVNASEYLQKTIKNLENRGLLQYDKGSQHYDLHPVVRGVAAGRLQQSEKEQYGKKVVDYFSEQTTPSFREIENLNELSSNLQVINAYIQMGNYQYAYTASLFDILSAMWSNLEGYAEMLALIKPFFPDGFEQQPKYISDYEGALLSNLATVAMNHFGKNSEKISLLNYALTVYLKKKYWEDVVVTLGNITILDFTNNRLLTKKKCCEYALQIAEYIRGSEMILIANIRRFIYFTYVGDFVSCEHIWQSILPLIKKSNNHNNILQSYYIHVRYCLFTNQLNEESFFYFKLLAKEYKYRFFIRHSHRLEGKWRLQQQQYERATDALSKAIAMAHEVGLRDSESETLHAMAKFHLGELQNAEEEAERLSENPDHMELAELWMAIGNKEKTAKHATEAYKEAWADGEPYVYRYSLDKAKAILEELGEPIPEMPAFDDNKTMVFPWEEDLKAAIEELKAEKEVEAAKRAEEENEED